MPIPNDYLAPTPVIPGYLLISAITNANPCVVTIVNSIENTYQSSQLLYFSVPFSYGMYQINGMIGQISNVSGVNFTVNIDTTQFNPFVIPAAPQQQVASVSPAGSRNLQFSNFTRQVPFQSLNNQGN